MKKFIMFVLTHSVFLSPLTSNASFGFVRLNIGDLSVQSDRFHGLCSEKIMKKDDNEHKPYVIYSNLQLQKTLNESEKSKCQNKPNFNFVKVSFDEDKNSGTITIAEGRELVEGTLMPKETASFGVRAEMIGYYSRTIVVSPADIEVFKSAHTMIATAENRRDVDFSCVTESEKRIRPLNHLFTEITERVVSCNSIHEDSKLSFKLRLKLDFLD